MNAENQAEGQPQVGSTAVLGGITFELHNYNPRRKQRGAEAAQLKVTEDGEEYLLWMSVQDIRANLKEWGESKGLRDALTAYKLNAMPPNDQNQGPRNEAPKS